MGRWGCGSIPARKGSMGVEGKKIVVVDERMVMGQVAAVGVQCPAVATVLNKTTMMTEKLRCQLAMGHQGQHDMRVKGQL